MNSKKLRQLADAEDNCESVSTGGMAVDLGVIGEMKDHSKRTDADYYEDHISPEVDCYEQLRAEKAIRENLRMFVIRLARRVFHFSPDDPVANHALFYLGKHGMGSSPLRSDDVIECEIGPIPEVKV